MTLAMAGVVVENDAVTNRILGLRQQNAIQRAKIDPRVTDPKDIKILIEKEKALQKAKKDAKKEGIFAVSGIDNKIKAIEKEIADITKKYEDVDLESKDVIETKTKYKEVIQAVSKDIARKVIKNKAKFAKIASKMLGFKSMELHDNEESYIGAFVQEKMADFMSELSPEEVEDISDREIQATANYYAEQAVKTDGVMITTKADGSKRIMINVERAAEIGAINVAQHEVLHGVLKMALSKMAEADKKDGGKRVKDLISGFKKQIETHFGEKIVGEIETRLLGEYKREIKENSDFMSTTDEWFTMLSDIVDNEYRPDATWDDISQDHKNFFDKMKTFIPSILRAKTPYKKLSIATGEDAFNFMREYGKNIKEGKLSEGMVAFAKGDKGPTTTQDTEDSFSKTVAEQIIDDKPFENKIQDLYEKGDLDAIQEAYKPRIKRILRSEWGWTEENESKFNAIVEEAVGPDRGILQMILGPGKTKYDPARGVPLSGHIGSIMQKRGLSEYVTREYPEGVIEQQMGKESVAKEVNC